MTPSLLLEKIIEKAVKNGFDFVQIEPRVKGWKSFKTDKHDVEVKLGETYMVFSHSEIMFSHSFTKAFFGEKLYVTDGRTYGSAWIDDHKTTVGSEPAWKAHLKRLALTPPEERLSYLSKYL